MFFFTMSYRKNKWKTIKVFKSSGMEHFFLIWPHPKKDQKSTKYVYVTSRCECLAHGAAAPNLWTYLRGNNCDCDGACVGVSRLCHVCYCGYIVLACFLVLRCCGAEVRSEKVYQHIFYYFKGFPPKAPT